MPLWPDSVNRVSCISFLTRAMISRASCIRPVFFNLKAFLSCFANEILSEPSARIILELRYACVWSQWTVASRAFFLTSKFSW